MALALPRGETFFFEKQKKRREQGRSRGGPTLELEKLGLDRWITSSFSWAFSSRNASISERSSCGLVGPGAGGSSV